MTAVLSDWLLSVNADWSAWHPCSGSMRTVYTHKVALSSSFHTSCQFGHRESRVCTVHAGYRLVVAQSVAQHCVPAPLAIEWAQLITQTRDMLSLGDVLLIPVFLDKFRCVFYVVLPKVISFAVTFPTYQILSDLFGATTPCSVVQDAVNLKLQFAINYFRQRRVRLTTVSLLCVTCHTVCVCMLSGRSSL